MKAKPGKRDANDIQKEEKWEDRSRDGSALAEATELRPELVQVLPVNFPDDIPLGNWMAIHSVRKMGSTDFVVSCSTSYRREAVGEFYARTMKEKGWQQVSHSSRPILTVYTFRKDQRVVTLMIKKQVYNEDVAFDISYKES